MFQACPADCAVQPPEWAGQSCGAIVQKGGIKHFLIVKCTLPNIRFLTDAELCAAVAAGDIKLSPELLAEKPEAETTSSDTASCSPAEITGYTHTINWQSFRHDPTNMSDFAYWNYLKRNIKFLSLYYIGCDGLIYGILPSPTFSSSHMIELKSTDKAGFMGTLSWNQFDDIVPFRRDLLWSALSGGCIDGPNGFTIEEEMGSTLSLTVGGAPATISGLEVARQACNQDVVINIVQINVLSGGPDAPVATPTNIAGPSATTGGQISFDPQAADAGVYEYIYTVSACDDSYTRSVVVTVNA